MNPLDDSGAIFSYHRDMMKQHGNTGSGALGWRNKQSQLTRFNVLAGIADLNNHSIMDAGCGHADLWPYLHNLYQNMTYTGIEQIPELLDVAMQRYGNDPQTTFISGNFISGLLAPADYTLVCGSLNYHSSDAGYIYKAIRRLYNNSRCGLGFNLLSQIIPNGLIVAYDSEVIGNYCRSVCNNVVLKTGYSAEDFTIFMYR